MSAFGHLWHRSRGRTGEERPTFRSRERIDEWHTLIFYQNCHGWGLCMHCIYSSLADETHLYRYCAALTMPRAFLYDTRHIPSSWGLLLSQDSFSCFFSPFPPCLTMQTQYYFHIQETHCILDAIDIFLSILCPLSDKLLQNERTSPKHSVKSRI